MAKDKNGKKNNGKSDRRRWHDGLAQETKQSVLAVVLLGLCVLLILAWFGKAGSIGNGLYSLFSILFGKGFFLVPLACLLAAFSLFLHVHERFAGATPLGGTLFLLSSLGLAHIIFGNMAAGYVGFAVAFLPLKFLDFWASLVIFSVLLVISFLVMFNMPLTFRKKDAPHAPDDALPESVANVLPLEEVGSGMLANAKGALASAFAITQAPEKSSATELAPAAFPPKEPDTFPHLARASFSSNYVPPPLSLLEDDRGKPSSGDIKANANIIQRTLQTFGIDVDMGEINIGPSVTQYTLRPAEGVKLTRITNLSNDLGLALAAHPIRIEAPIPGRSLVGIEVPNKSISFVGLRSLMGELLARKDRSPLAFALGRDVTGQAAFADLARAPHMLIAGSTGSGKSVAIHSLLLNLLFNNSPETLRFLLIDPKRVELTYYNDIPHLLVPVIVEAKQALQALRWAVKEMERRYEQLADAGVRDVASYNAGVEAGEGIPYIVVVIDELADLMSTYQRDVEAAVVRLAQMARAVGMHLVVSTQRPSVEVITGLIKANITTRIALQVASQIDSRTILDMAGAEKLLGHGDMLYLAGDAAKPRRIQGAYVSEGEVKKVTRHLKNMGDTAYEEAILMPASGSLGGGMGEDDIDDDMYEEARAVVVEAGKASASYLQRKLRVGYARAARLLDMLEERGVIGPGEGAKPREVLVKDSFPAAELLES